MKRNISYKTNKKKSLQSQKFYAGIWSCQQIKFKCPNNNKHGGQNTGIKFKNIKFKQFFMFSPLFSRKSCNGKAL